MNTLILNRGFQHPSDGWYQLEAMGVHPNQPARVEQVIDDAAVIAIVNRFNAEAKAGTLRHGHEMLIDHEHFSDQPDQETRAYGWLQELQNRDDGYYGRIRWTTTGKAAVDGGDYRFFSTEYDPQDLKVLNDGKVRKVRPLRLGGLTLTNMNNNRGQRPITNRGGASAQTFAGAGASAANQQNPNQEKMKSIATKLGLAAEASEEAILAEVTNILNRATTAEAEIAPLKNRVTTLETTNKTLLDGQVETLLTSYGVTEEKIKNRLKPVLVACEKHEDRIATLADFGFKPGEAKAQASGASGRVLNRGTGSAVEQQREAGSEVAEQERAVKIMNRASAIVKESPTIGLATATAMATREIK